MAGVRWGAERRILRRASHESLKVPVFRDQSFNTLSQNTPAASYARGDWDAEYRRGDVEHDAPPSAVREMSRPQSTRIPPPPPNTLTFKPASQPRHGSHRVVLVLIAVAVVALVVSAVLLVMRSPSGRDEESTTVTPTATTSAVPPRDISRGDPLPIPPPPPPPETPPPADTGRYYPVSPPNDENSGRPQRPGQISVAPSIKPSPEVGHSAPGDAPHRRRGFW